LDTGAMRACGERAALVTRRSGASGGGRGVARVGVGGVRHGGVAWRGSPAPPYPPTTTLRLRGSCPVHRLACRALLPRASQAATAAVQPARPRRAPRGDPCSSLCRPSLEWAALISHFPVPSSPASHPFEMSLSTSEMWAQRTDMRVFLVAPQLAIEYRVHFKPLVTPRTVRNATARCRGRSSPLAHSHPRTGMRMHVSLLTQQLCPPPPPPPPPPSPLRFMHSS
jgi:hypothetical protein